MSFASPVLQESQLMKHADHQMPETYTADLGECIIAAVSA